VRSPTPGCALGRAEEVAVVSLAICGDDAAYAELVKRRQSWLRNLLRRLCRNPALADDLAQQTFLQAWRSIRGLKSPAAFGAWLRRLALNAWLAHARSRKSAMESAMEPVCDDNAELQVTDTGGERIDLDQALTHLAEEMRLCVVLAYSESMSHSEISEVIGLPLGTVKSHIKRGSERLRAILHAYEPIGGVQHVR